MTEFNLSNKEIILPLGKLFFKEDVKEFITNYENIIIEEINKTDGSQDFNLNNLYERISIKRCKIEGDKLI